MIGKILNKKISLVLLIAWMIVIFTLSSMSGNKSNGTTKKVLEQVLSETNIVDKSELTSEKINNNSSKFGIIHYCFRKALHVTEYLILAILVMNYLRFYNLKIIIKFLISVIFCFLYSITDEVHQIFTFNRTPLFSDCLIDTSGAVIGSLIFVLFFIIYKSRQKVGVIND